MERVMANFSKKPGGRFRLRVATAAVATCFATTPVWSLPTGVAVVNGTATLDQVGQVLNVTNSNGAILNWQQFNIAAGETTRFIQASASSSVLNRVVGGDLSAIYGTLSSNGRVWLVNPAGILIGASGVINTAGFIASTLPVRNEDFLAGKLTFTGPGGNLVNRGTITTPSGGSVYLVGANVSNEGVINTPQGEVILAAGQTVNLVDTATPGVKVEIVGSEGDVTNLGEIAAEAGRIGMAGVIVRNSGTLNAGSAVAEGGKVFLRASQDAYVDGNGRIVATGTRGGQVEVLGKRVAVMDNARIDASGENGGGRVLVGGDYQGRNPDVQNSQITYFGANASIKANAEKVGDGGTVIVWADDTTRAYGSIEAKGGASAGNGGFVEVSGKRYLDFNGHVDTRAPNGQGGTLLLDPTDITIVTTYGGPPDFGTFTGGIFDGAVYGASVMGWDYINGQLSSTNVVIQTASGGGGSGNITVTGAGVLAGGANSLSLLAENNLTFSTGAGLYHSGSGSLTLVAGWDNTSLYSSPTTLTTAGTITINAGANIGTNLASSGGIVLKAGNAINIIDATVGAGGTMSVSAESLTISAVTGPARLMSQGNQTITLGAGEANGIMQMTSTVGEARLSTYGSQTISFQGSAANTLSLIGSNSNTTYGGNAARIEASGTQAISHSGSLAITLAAGNGTATYGGSSTHNGVEICATCATHNEAQIRSGGNQTINATAITITGGSGGNGNWAGIESKASSTVTATGAITITGGAGGGYYNPAFGNDGYVSNDAGISADGALTVSAGSITLNGGGASYGGAYIGGSSSVNVVASGNITLTGGSTAAQGAALLYTDPSPSTLKWLAPAVIGSDAGSLANVTVTSTAGSISLNGGAMGQDGGSQAMIGGAFGTPANVVVNSYGGVTLTGTSALSARIGSHGGGSVVVNSGIGGTGALDLGNGLVGTSRNNGGSITLNAQGTGGSIGQTVAGLVVTDSLNAISTQGGINLQSTFNRVGHLDALASNGSIVFAGDTVGVGTVRTTTGTSNITLSLQNAIYDDNGGAANIITDVPGTVTLSSVYGGMAGALAISADVQNASTIVATVSGTATNGGIRIGASGAASPTAVTLTDSAAGNTSAVFNNSNSFSTNAYSLTALNGGTVGFGSSGDLTYNGGTLNTGGSGAIVLSAAGTLAISAALAGGTDDVGLSGNVLTIGAGVTGNNIALAGNTVNVTAYGGVTAATDLFAIAGGTLNVDGSMTSSGGNLGLFSVGTVNINGGTLSAYYDIGMWANTGINLTNASVTASFGDIYMGSGAAMLLNPVTNVATIRAGDITMYGGTVSANEGNIYAFTAGNIRLNNGAVIKAGDDVTIGLVGAGSTLYLNDTPNGTASKIVSDVFTAIPATTHITFYTRTAGGIIIDGVAGSTTTTGGSGFYWGPSPHMLALPGSGLDIAYSSVLDPAVSNILNNTTTTTTNLNDGQGLIVPPPPGSGGMGSALSGQSTGGGEGEFGGKDDDDKKNGNNENGKKPDDKPGGKKPVAQCQA